MKKIYINGMKCSHCGKKVRSALEEIGGTDIKVDLDTKTVMCNIDRSNDEIVDIIADYGFDVDNIE